MESRALDRTQLLKRAGVGAVAIASVSAIPAALAGGQGGRRGRLEWYIVSLDFSTTPPRSKAGGFASASAGDGSKITITGEGTFGPRPTDVTGGGTWTTFDPSGAETDSGTYTVVRFIYWVGAPGTLAPTANSDIGDIVDARAGVGVLQVRYSTKEPGVLTVNCRLPIGSPPWIAEAITMTKGNVNYFDPELPAPGVDANRNVFWARGQGPVAG